MTQGNQQLVEDGIVPDTQTVALPRTLDEIKAVYTAANGPIWRMIKGLINHGGDGSISVDPAICAAIDEAFQAGGLAMIDPHDAATALPQQTIGMQSEEIARLKALFRVNMLRLNPGLSHAEIDAAMAMVMKPPADAFHGQAPANPPHPDKDAYAACGEALGVDAPKPAPATPGPKPAHGIGRVSSLLGEWK